MAQIISYEEYAPYGSSTYQATRGTTEATKRYRYTGKERDEESGFSHHGARYYAPWLGRWVSCDPAGVAAGPNAYSYAAAAPVALVDDDGLAPMHPEDRDIHQVWTESPAGGRTSATSPSGASAIPRGKPHRLGLSPTSSSNCRRSDLPSNRRAVVTMPRPGKWPSAITDVWSVQTRQSWIWPTRRTGQSCALERRQPYNHSADSLRTRPVIRTRPPQPSGGQTPRTAAAKEGKNAWELTDPEKFARPTPKQIDKMRAAAAKAQTRAGASTGTAVAEPPAAVEPPAAKPTVAPQVVKPTVEPTATKPAAPVPATKGVAPPVAPKPAGGAAPSVLENIAGKAGTVLGVVGGVLSVRTLANDLMMHTDPANPRLGPVGTQRTDSMGTVWIKIDEKTWVTPGYLEYVRTHGA